jgi:hypothetical protein
MTAETAATHDDKGPRRLAHRVTPRARGTRLAPALRVARQLLLDAPFAAAEIVVISDLQRAGAVGSGRRGGAHGRHRARGAGGPRHVGEQHRAPSTRARAADGDRTLLAVKARVQPWLPAPRTAHRDARVNGRDAATESVTLARDGERSSPSRRWPPPMARWRCSVHLSPDALAADDTLVAVVPRDDALRVALVTDGRRSERDAVSRTCARHRPSPVGTRMERVRRPGVRRCLAARRRAVLGYGPE